MLVPGLSQQQHAEKAGRKRQARQHSICTSFALALCLPGWRWLVLQTRGIWVVALSAVCHGGRFMEGDAPGEADLCLSACMEQRCHTPRWCMCANNNAAQFCCTCCSLFVTVARWTALFNIRPQALKVLLVHSATCMVCSIRYSAAFKPCAVFVFF